MFKPKQAFSGFSVNDLPAAKKFYGETLGVKLADDGIGARLHLPGGGSVFVYPKRHHQPATFTILNFLVDDIDAAVDDLTRRGVKFERYDNGPQQDAKGVLRGRAQNRGPDIAWFKDPAENVLSVIEEG